MLKDWIEEFYPVPAHEVLEKDSLDHSLQKWIGLRAANLAKHGLVVTFDEIRDTNNDSLAIIAEACALCHVHKDCKTCPIYFQSGNDCSSGSAYNDWIYHSDPEPMIALLEKCKADSLAYKEYRDANRDS
jgi:hypothetical protein